MRSVQVSGTVSVCAPMCADRWPAQLVWTCGTENAITAVQELEKCEYEFTGTSPALCLPPGSPENGRKDEL